MRRRRRLIRVCSTRRTILVARRESHPILSRFRFRVTEADRDTACGHSDTNADADRGTGGTG
jgi:hypothetical protein